MYIDFPLWVTLLAWRLTRRRQAKGGTVALKDVSAYVIALKKVKALVQESENLTWIEEKAGQLLLNWTIEEIRVVEELFETLLRKEYARIDREKTEQAVLEIYSLPRK